VIETPTDAASATARVTLERDLVAHAALIDRVRGLVAEASGGASSLPLAHGTHGGAAWQGLASRAFSAAARNLTRELAQIDERLLEAGRLIDAASYEVRSGV
jgi:hypothetical protein